MVLGEASEATVHGGTVRWRRRRRRRWRQCGGMGVERETRRGANVMYSGGDRLHSAQGEADFGIPNTPPGLVSGAGCCHFTVNRMNSILTIKCTTVVLLLVLVGT